MAIGQIAHVESKGWSTLAQMGRDMVAQSAADRRAKLQMDHENAVYDKTRADKLTDYETARTDSAFDTDEANMRDDEREARKRGDVLEDNKTKMKHEKDLQGLRNKGALDAAIAKVTTTKDKYLTVAEVKNLHELVVDNMPDKKNKVLYNQWLQDKERVSTLLRNTLKGDRVKLSEFKQGSAKVNPRLADLQSKQKQTGDSPSITGSIVNTVSSAFDGNTETKKPTVTRKGPGKETSKSKLNVRERQELRKALGDLSGLNVRERMEQEELIAKGIINRREL